MAAPAFRAEAHKSYGATVNTTITKPTGTVDGDIMVSVLFAGSSDGQVPSMAVTPPAGWTLIGTITARTSNSLGFHGSLHVYWKRASSEGANYTWTHASLSTDGIIASYSGCIASGSPVDVFSQNGANSTTATGTAVTTTVADTRLVFGAHNWDGSGTLTPPTGMTERYDSLTYLADQAVSGTGSTGTRTQTVLSAEPWQVYMIALKPVAVTAYSVTATAGSYALTGSAATLTKASNNKTLAAAAGGYTLSGSAVTLSKTTITARTLTAAAGSYALTGADATLIKSGIAIPAFRAVANTSYGSNTGSVTCLKPTGTIDGDVMLAFLVQARDTLATVPVPPPGWTQVGAYRTVTNSFATFYARSSVWWKRASSEGTDYTWTLGETANTQLIIGAYSGCVPTGNPIDASSSNGVNGDVSATALATSVTTTVANTKLIYTGHNWTGAGNLLPPTGMTERVDSLAYWADQDNAAVGATGDREQFTEAGPLPWTAFLVALKPTTGLTGYSVTATAGAYTLTGSNAGFTRRLQTTAGAYALTGSPAGFFHLVGGVPVFRAVASVIYQSRTGVTTVAKPTGTVNGDVMIATFFGGSNDENAIQITTIPAGWTQIGTTVSQSSDASFFGKLWVFWRRASGEGASYDFGHTATLSTQATITSYSGCAPSGNPVNAFSQANGIGSTATALGVTTTAGDTKLVYTGHNWDATGALTPPSGMTERFDNLIYTADEDRHSTGATGDRTQAQAAFNPWQAYLVALKPGGALSTYTMTAESGSYRITGTTVTSGRGLMALAGSYTLTGRAVILRARGSFGINAVAGSYSLTGAAATLTKGGEEVIEPTLSGMNVWTGSAWVDKPVKVWTGSAWVEKPVKVWNGSAWV